MTRASILELSRLRRNGHQRCLACTHPQLKLDFTLDGPHRLRTSVDFNEEMTSFNGMVHGGRISLLIDEAMTCALMAEGHYGATGELKVRYHHPVSTGSTAYLSVTIDSSWGRLYKLSAELKQGGKIRTSAEARFMKLACREDSGEEVYS